MKGVPWAGAGLTRPIPGSVPFRWSVGLLPAWGRETPLTRGWRWP